MSGSSLVLHCGARQLDREALRNLPVPASTATFKPIPHIEVVEKLIETLNFRQIAIVKEEYAVSENGLRVFGILTLASSFDEARYVIGFRNGNDRQVRLAMTVGVKVFICDNLSFNGEYTPVLAKHSSKFNIVDTLSVGVDRMQRAFGPMQKQIESWKGNQLTDTQAKTVIYDAFIGGALDVPRHLARDVHQNYFEPPHKEFEGRNAWSLQNAFTESFKRLDGTTFFQATAKLGAFFHERLPATIVKDEPVLFAPGPKADEADAIEAELVQ